MCVCFFGQCYCQYFDQDVVNVVFWLLFGQVQRVYLNVIVEVVVFGVFNIVVFLIDFVLKFDESMYFVYFGDEVNVCVYEEGNVGYYWVEIFGRDVWFQCVQNCLSGG